MSPRVKVLDGKVFGGDMWDDVVQAMWDNSFNVSPSLQSYMRLVALRVKDMYGKVISTASPREFIYALRDAGLLEVEDATEKAQSDG